MLVERVCLNCYPINVFGELVLFENWSARCKQIGVLHLHDHAIQQLLKVSSIFNVDSLP
jgi:hypothetical protein